MTGQDRYRLPDRLQDRYRETDNTGVSEDRQTEGVRGESEETQTKME